jgi:hypothetical protein
LFDPLSQFFVPIFFAAFFGALCWLLFGRDPRSRKSIMPHYDPPADLNLVELGILYDDIFQNKDLGYQFYEYYFQDIITFEKDSIVLKFPPESPQFQKLNTTDQDILKILFDNQTVAPIQSDWFKERLKMVRRKIYQNLTAKGYYKSSPRQQRKFLYIAAKFFITAPFIYDFFWVFMAWNEEGEGFFGSFDFSWQPWMPLPLFFGIMFAGLILGLFGRLTCKKTIVGSDKLHEILGFKEFIITAEKDRIEHFLKTEPQAYKKVIPYAFLFGVQEKWLAPMENLHGKLADPSLLEFTGLLDEESIEQAFENSHNPLFSFGNVILYSIIKAASTRFR